MIDSHMFGYEPVSGTAAGAGAQAAAAMRARAAKSSEAMSNARDLRDLEDRFERLSLVCMAMWSLLQDKTNLTEADLLERVRTIDLMDEQADGKASKVGVVRCAACSRPMNQRHIRCIYCGADKHVASAFDRV